MASPLESALRARASDKCELCGSIDRLVVFPVPPGEPSADRAVLVCGRCHTELTGDEPLDALHWRCLQQAAWSEVLAVQVLSWRLLTRLGESWAIDLRDQIYLDDDALAWAQHAGEAADEPAVRTLDSNGAVLAEGDSVTLIKDLEVKGASFTAKRGTLVKNIHLTDNPAHVEGRVNNIAIVLKTEFLKKAL